MLNTHTEHTETCPRCGCSRAALNNSEDCSHVWHHYEMPTKHLDSGYVTTPVPNQQDHITAHIALAEAYPRGMRVFGAVLSLALMVSAYTVAMFVHPWFIVFALAIQVDMFIGIWECERRDRLIEDHLDTILARKEQR